MIIKTCKEKDTKNVKKNVFVRAKYKEYKPVIQRCSCGGTGNDPEQKWFTEMVNGTFVRSSPFQKHLTSLLALSCLIFKLPSKPPPGFFHN